MFSERRYCIFALPDTVQQKQFFAYQLLSETDKFYIKHFNPSFDYCTMLRYTPNYNSFYVTCKNQIHKTTNINDALSKDGNRIFDTNPFTPPDVTTRKINVTKLLYSCNIRKLFLNGIKHLDFNQQRILVIVLPSYRFPSKNNFYKTRNYYAYKILKSSKNFNITDLYNKNFDYYIMLKYVKPSIYYGFVYENDAYYTKILKSNTLPALVDKIKENNYDLMKCVVFRDPLFVKNNTECI